MPHPFSGPAVEIFPFLLWRSEEIDTAGQVATAILENKRQTLKDRTIKHGAPTRISQCAYLDDSHVENHTRSESEVSQGRKALSINVIVEKCRFLSVHHAREISSLTSPNYHSYDSLAHQKKTWYVIHNEISDRAEAQDIA